MRLALPTSFRPADILAFQARDPQQLAERVDADGFAKGLIWHGAPACLRVAFQHGHVNVELDVDGTPASAGAVAGLARHAAGRILTDALAWRIEAGKHHVAVDVLHGEKRLRIEAGRLIWAAPAFVLPRVWPAMPGTLREAALAADYAPWLVANLHLSAPIWRDAVLARYRGRYAGEPLVRVHEAAPWVSHIAHAHHVDIGGFQLSDDGRRLVVVATEDNLLKGAATQALQNLNLAFGLDEFAGIPLPEDDA